MPVCSGCTRVKNLIGCPTDIVIGHISTTPNTAYTVFIERLTGGRVWQFLVTSDASGLITVDVGALQDTLAGSMSFNFWVAPTYPGDMGNKQTVLLPGGETDDCFVVSFETVYNYQGGIHKVTPQTFRA